MATNNRILAFDNASDIKPWLSDSLCSLSTGGGFATRALHTDQDEFLFNGARPILMNGIGDLAQRSDLADRALVVDLPAIPADKRRTEKEVNAQFEEIRPRLLGALLDACVDCLREERTDPLAQMPRMADFLRSILPAATALGTDPASLVAAFSANQDKSTMALVDVDPVFAPILELVDAQETKDWAGTAKALLEELETRVEENRRRQRDWPGTPQKLGFHLRRIATLLRKNGLEVGYRHSGSRFIVLSKVEPSTIEHPHDDPDGWLHGDPPE